MAFEATIRDDIIDDIRRVEGLLAYAVEHHDEPEIWRLKMLLDKVAEGRINGLNG